MKTTAVHRGAWKRGGVAARGAGAAGRPRAADRRAHVWPRMIRGEASPRGVHTSASGLGLDRWPQRADGLSVGRRRHQSDTSARAGVGRPATRHHPDKPTLATAALQRETQTIPIVFAGVTDPVASGIVARLDRPSGNNLRNIRQSRTRHDIFSSKAYDFA